MVAPATPTATLTPATETPFVPAGAPANNVPSPATEVPEAGSITVPPGAILGYMGRMTGQNSQAQDITLPAGEAERQRMLAQIGQMQEAIAAILAQWGLVAPMAPALAAGSGGGPSQKDADAGARSEPEIATIARLPDLVADAELQSELEEYLRSRQGTYGVALRNLDTGQTVLINADSEFSSASTYKVLVMYRVYQYIEGGLLDASRLLTITQWDAVEGEPDNGVFPGETISVADALEAMITVSSNTSAYALTRLVGGWQSISIAANELGMSQTGLQADGFRTTPADMLRFFEMLSQGQLVSANVSHSMMELLARQTVNDAIPSLLPDEAIVAHKTGELPGVRNDAGIVYGPGGRYIICMLSERANEDEAIESIAHVSLRAYQRYAQ